MTNRRSTQSELIDSEFVRGSIEFKEIIHRGSGEIVKKKGSK